MQGLVLKALGQTYNVLTESGEVVLCTLKGLMRTKNVSTTNPVVVGDQVEYMPSPPNDHIISAVKPRKNYIIRNSKKLSKQFQIIAANIDQVFILVTISQPKTNNTFIDRILTTAEAYQIDAHLIFNKIDAYDEEELEDM
ncbi:MAG TPA: GTPase RsgA, partial [Bacteroidia bacterium]|nr:GTPase RsgA [Bacteroidia bacterium]